MTALRLDARGAWEFDLDNGVTVRLGRRQVDERFERFMNAALQVVAQRARRHRLRRHALHQRVRHRLARRAGRTRQA